MSSARDAVFSKQMPASQATMHEGFEAAKPTTELTDAQLVAALAHAIDSLSGGVVELGRFAPEDFVLPPEARNPEEFLGSLGIAPQR